MGRIGCAVTRFTVGDGLDGHHCPSKKCHEDAHISSEEGPSITMEGDDHKLTATYGKSKDAQQCRDEQKKLLKQSKLDEAIQMNGDDIRGKFGDKYDDAIEEMLEYAKTLDPQNFIPR